MSFQFDTSKMVKGGLAALAIVGGLALASPAAAVVANVIILSGSMTSPLVVNISGAGGGDTYAAPMQFGTIYDGTPVDLIAFCVDVFHHINFSPVGGYNPDLQYTDANPWDTNYAYAPSVPAFTQFEVTQVARLVHFGTDVFNNASAGLAKRTQLAAVQSAIWEVVANRNVVLSTGYGQGGLDHTAFNALVNNLAGASYLDFIGAYGPVGSDATLITPLVYPNLAQGTQAFLFAVVPEPATWALMIGGFGAAGAMLRRRRAGPALAA